MLVNKFPENSILQDLSWTPQPYLLPFSLHLCNQNSFTSACHLPEGRLTKEDFPGTASGQQRLACLLQLTNLLHLSL